MTIRLLATYRQFKPNTIVTLASGTETMLVSGGNATTDLSGGVPFDYKLPANTRQNNLSYAADGVALGVSDSTGKILSAFAGIAAPGVPTGLALTAIAGGVLATMTAPASNGGTAIIGYEVTLSTGQVQIGENTTVTINAPAGVAVTATAKAINGFDKSAASAVSNSATPTATGTAPVAPAVTGVAAITGAPTQGVPLAITSATFSGTPTPTVARVIRMDGVQVASGTQSTTYTPVAGDIGKIPSVTDTATNTAGTAFSTGAGSAVAATPATYSRIKAALQNVAGGTGYAKIAPVGDSTTTGYGSGLPGSALANGRPISPTALLKTALAAAQALPVIANSWVGDGGCSNNGTSLFAYDPRLTLPDGAGWANSLTSAITAGCRHEVNTSNTTRMAFLPTDGSCDTFEITTPVNTTLGSLNAARTGMSNATINQNGAANIAKTVLTSTLSNANPLYINRIAGLGYVMGVDAWDSTVKSIRLQGVGWNAGKTADWIDSATAFNPFPALKAIGAHLYVLRPGINEWLNSVPVATFKANLETLVDGLLTVGDVLLCTPYPSQITTTPLATQQLYVDVILAVAAARGLQVENTFAKWGSWEAANALGYMGDSLHPNQTGYQSAAADCAAKIVSIAPVAAIPVIATPVAVGTPATFSSAGTVTAQQWSLDAVDVGGATASTYTQALADSGKALRVRATTANGNATSLPAVPGLRNMKLSNTTKLRAMLAGGVRGIILGLGDSCIAGYGAGNTPNELGMRPNNYFTLLAQKLNAAGIPTSPDSSIGGGTTNVNATFLSSDPRWALGGGTTLLGTQNNVQATGGALMNMTANADTAKFTPGTPFDTCLVLFARTATSGVMQYSFDNFATVAGSITTVQASAGMGSVEIACPANSTFISFRGNGTSCFLSGLKTRVAAVPKIEIVNAAMSGTTVQINARPAGTASATDAFVPRATMPLIDPAVPRVMFLNGWINDRTASRTVQNVLDDYKTICDEAKARGDDIIYYGYAQFATPVISRANFDLYEEAIVTFLINTYDAVIYQNNRVFTTQEANTSYYADNLHLGTTGYAKTADGLFAVMKIAAAGTLPA